MDSPHVRDPNLKRCAAGLPASGHAKEGEDSVFRGREALGFDAKLVEHLSPVGEEPDDLFAASDRSLADSAVGNPFGVRVHQFRRACHILGVHRPVEPKHHLHVLLRHRLLPQPGGFEGLTLVGEAAESDNLPIAEVRDPRRRLVKEDATFAPLRERPSEH